MTETPTNTETILVAGTASHVGKSTVVAGICRFLAERGVDVAPFKAQNMSNNAHVGRTPDGEWGELGVSQYVQARAARVPPSTDHNPVLLKPRGNGESQLVVDGDAVGHYEAGAYYDEHWTRARRAARDAHERLAAAHDVVVAEGAGSIAEINLHDRDLANVETARFGDAQIVLLGDVERGGVFASLYGTLELMPPDLRDRVVGTVITKFRGDRSILEPGISELEARTGVPVLATLPYDDPGLPAEDSLDLPSTAELASGDGSAIIGADDGVPDTASVTVGVVRLPHISNATDFQPLAREPGVRVRYVHPTHASAHETIDLDALVLPGTKNTVDDLHALRDAGFGSVLERFDGPVLGICGGFQMLGERIRNASIEGTDRAQHGHGAADDDTHTTEADGSQNAADDDVLEGFGLLPVETVFSTDKTVEAVSVDVEGGGVLPAVEATVDGYEIHMGETSLIEDETPRSRQAVVRGPLGPSSVSTGDVGGTYLHGLFQNASVRQSFLECIDERTDRTRHQPALADRLDERVDPFDAAADLVGPLCTGLEDVIPELEAIGSGS